MSTTGLSGEGNKLSMLGLMHRCLFIVMLLVSSQLHAVVDYPITPKSLLEQVELRGLAEVHDEIFSHPYAVNMVLLAIDSAQPEWLDVAELFLQEQNPISGPRLIMAIGEGLQWQPENVLRRGFPLERICTLQGLYEWRNFSLFLSNTAIQRRLASLEVLAKSNKRAQLCSQLLRKTQRRLSASMSNDIPEHHH